MFTTKNTYFGLIACAPVLILAATMLMSFVGKQDVANGEWDRMLAANVPDIAPVDLARVTKVVQYGEMLDPRTNEKRNHRGIDFQLSEGSAVVATADGIVIGENSDEYRGNFVIIKHSESYTTRYYHLQAAVVKNGDRISKAQLIGRVGNTGLSSIHHLHYEVIKEGKEVDPRGYLPKLPDL